eukprot:5570391-Pleurochrysis_carterae.AAC.2
MPRNKAPPEKPKRASKRKSIPTTTMIGGYAVKRQNMYDMEEGEGSVWTSELDKDGRALKRTGAFAPVARPASGARASTPKTSVKSKASAKKHTQSESEKQRLEQNELLRAEGAKLASKRAAWFLGHRDLLAPFVDSRTLAKLEATAASAGAPPARRRIDVQPETVVGGEMRDYQLSGLDWFVDCYERRGASTILGDEMGLGARAPHATQTSQVVNVESTRTWILRSSSFIHAHSSA